MTAPLTGVKVLDLSRFLPGPYCSMILGDLGADVIKIEEPKFGDPARLSPPFIGGESSYFLLVNRNKKSLTLNLKDARGVRIFHQLAETADVVIESFRPGTVDRFGITYDQIRRTNPRIIYCSLSGYGQDGPYTKRAGHDINYLAVGGALGLTADKLGRLAVPGVQVADFGGGLAATVAILAALFGRQRTGMGQHIDISLLEVVLSEMIVPLASVFAGENLPIGSKYGLTGAHPFYNVYETKDGNHLAFGALEPKFWQEFCSAINRPDLLNKQYAEGKDRERLFEELEALFRSRTTSEWLDTFANRDVCIEPVLTLNESLDHPQVKHRESITEVDHPTLGPIKQVRSPIRLSETPATMRSSPPRFGEHTDEILQSLGYSKPELKELRDAGVV